MKTATQATILIRGINPQQLLKDFLAGKYNDLEIPTGKIIKKSAAKQHVQEMGIGHGPFDAIYERTISTGTYRVYTTNVELFNYFVAELAPESSTATSIKESRPIVGCDYCHRPIDLDGLLIPAPIWMEERDGAIFWTGEYVTGHKCCARAIIRDEKKKNPLSALYKDSEHILNYVLEKLTGSSEGEPAPHWKLLKSNGGSMDDETFYGGEIQLQKLPNLFFLPAKAQWETKV